MAEAFDKERTFVLFRTDKAVDAKSPHYNGSFVLNGIEYDLSGWIRESRKSGAKFISGRLIKRADNPYRKENQGIHKGQWNDQNSQKKYPRAVDTR